MNGAYNDKLGDAMSTADDIRLECAALYSLAEDAAQELAVCSSVELPTFRFFSRAVSKISHIPWGFVAEDHVRVVLDRKLALVAQGGTPVREDSILGLLVLLKAGGGSIWVTCDEIRDMLLAKNEAYGDSAMSPVRIFSRAAPEDALLVRIDDKLSRVARGDAAGEDVVLDMIGYLVLLRIARRRAGKAAS